MRVVVFGAINGLIAVALGAFSAHVLGGQLQNANPDAFETAVWYQLIHSVVLVALGGLLAHMSRTMVGLTAWAFGLGIVLFSYSIYALALGAPAEVGLLTPVGGGFLILGWILLAVSAAQGR